MGTKIPSQFLPKNTIASGNSTSDKISGSNLLGGNSLLSTEKEEDKQESNNKNTNLEIVGHNLKNVLPSIGKGATSAIDSIADFAKDAKASILTNKAEKTKTYTDLMKAQEAQNEYAKAESTHVLGDKVQAWEKKVDEKQEQIVKDNPDSKLANLSYKGLNLAESAGLMLPALALGGAVGAGAAALGVGGTALVGAATGAQLASTAASLGTMGMVVYDQSLDDSIKQGYDWRVSSKKALGDAVVEAATEMMFAGVGGLGVGVSKLFTKDAVGRAATRVASSEAAGQVVSKFGVKKAISSLGSATAKTMRYLEGEGAQSTVGKLLQVSLGEGIEEMVAEVLNPVIERATTNPYVSDATLDEIIEAGIGGAIISVGLGSARIASQKMLGVNEQTQTRTPEDMARDIRDSITGTQASTEASKRNIVETDPNAVYYKQNINNEIVRIAKTLVHEGVTGSDAEAFQNRYNSTKYSDVTSAEIEAFKNKYKQSHQQEVPEAEIEAFKNEYIQSHREEVPESEIKRFKRFYVESNTYVPQSEIQRYRTIYRNREGREATDEEIEAYKNQYKSVMGLVPASEIKAFKSRYIQLHSQEVPETEIKNFKSRYIQSHQQEVPEAEIEAFRNKNKLTLNVNKSVGISTHIYNQDYRRLAYEAIEDCERQGNTDEAVDTMLSKVSEYYKKDWQEHLDLVAYNTYENKTKNELLAKDEDVKAASQQLQDALGRLDTVSDEDFDALQSEIESLTQELDSLRARRLTAIEDDLKYKRNVDKYGQDVVDTFISAQRAKKLGYDVPRIAVEDELSGRKRLMTYNEFKDLYTMQNHRYQTTPLTVSEEARIEAEAERVFEEYQQEGYKAAQRVVDEANRAFSKTGIGDKLKIELSPLNQNESGQYRDGVITINAQRINSETEARYVLAHEFLHFVEDKLISQTQLADFHQQIKDAMDSLNFGYDKWYAACEKAYYAKYVSTFEAEGISKGLTDNELLNYVKSKMGELLENGSFDKIVEEEVRARFVSSVFNTPGALKALALSDYDKWYAACKKAHYAKYVSTFEAEGISKGLTDNELLNYVKGKMGELLENGSFNKIVEEEVRARFVSFVFNTPAALKALALSDNALVNSMLAAMESSAIDENVNDVWNYARLKALNYINRAIVSPEPASDLTEELREAEDVAMFDLEIESEDTMLDFDIDDFNLTDQQLQEYESLKARYPSRFGAEGLPSKLKNNQATSDFASRIVGDSNTPSTLKSTLQKDYLQGALSHTIITDRKNLDYARKQLDKHTQYTEAYTEAMAQLNNPWSVNSKTITYGELVLTELIDKLRQAEADTTASNQQEQVDGLVKMSEQLTSELASVATRTGQNLRAFALLKKMTPEGRLYFIDTQIGQLLQDLQDRASRKMIIDAKGNSNVDKYKYQRDKSGKYIYDANGEKIPIKVPDELRDKMLNASTVEELDAVEDEIVKAVAAMIPSNLSEKVVEYRYLAMLGNPRTHIRNIVSNVAMRNVAKVKNTVGGVIEDIVLANKTEGRTKTLLTGNADMPALRQFAAEDWDRDGMSEVAMNGGKLGFQSRIENERNKLGVGLLGKAAKGNKDLLEKEDSMSGKKNYQNAFARYCAANNLTLDYLTSNTASANTHLALAREYAVKEAARNTYHEASVIASELNKIEKTGMAAELIVGGIVPFKKTPINLLKQGVRYSPAGLMSGLGKFVSAIRSSVENYADPQFVAEMKRQLSQGKITKEEYNEAIAESYKDEGGDYLNAQGERTRAIADAIDQLASGLTGTGIMLVGYLLGSMGMMKAGGSDDTREEYYDEMLGNQEYSVTIDGKNYTLDWLTPISFPLFAGVELAKSTLEGDTMSFEDGVSAITKVVDPLTNLSVLQGVENAMSSYDSGVGKFVMSSAESYASQFVPTLFGQIARSTDDTRRSTYAPKTSDTSTLGKDLGTFKNRMLNKIPGMSQKNAAYVDQWGRTEGNGGDTFVERLFSNAVAPWYKRESNVTEADAYISRLFAVTDDSSVIPNTPGSSYNINDVTYRLTSKEYQQTKQLVGQLSNVGVNTLMQVQGFGDLNAEAQATVVGNVYEFARAVAKEDYANANNIEYTPSSTVSNNKAAVLSGLSIGQAIYIRYMTGQFETDKDENGEPISGSKKEKVIAFFKSQGLSKEQMSYFCSYDLSDI